MIYLFIAMYYEADIFIKQYGLKKVPESTYFQHFYNEEADMRLTVTGVGEIAAAAAVSSICTEYKPRPADVLFNIGICAGIHKPAGIFLVNKLVEQATGKTFYPDILYRHSFQEESLMTGMMPWTGGTDHADVSEVSLFDMEATAVYQAGSCFFGPHQMVFIKIISDCGRVREDLRQQIVPLMAAYKDEIVEFIGHTAKSPVYTKKPESIESVEKTTNAKRLDERQSIDQANRQEERENFLGLSDGKEESQGIDLSEGKAGSRGIDPSDSREEAWIQQVCTDMHCSKSMEYAFRQHIRYLYLCGIDYKALIQNMYAEGRLPCRDKREGKLCFEAFRKSLF